MKKIITGLKPIEKNKVALIGVDKEGKRPAILAHAFVDPQKMGSIDENATYEVDIKYNYNLQEKCTSIEITNFAETSTDVPRTKLYHTIATEARVLNVFDSTKKYATLWCKLDDNNYLAANAWYNYNPKVNQIQKNETLQIELTLGGVYEDKNQINAFLRSSTSASATTKFTTTTTTTKAVEPTSAAESAKPAVKKFNFNHLKNVLEQKGYEEYQENGKVQMGFITTCEKKTTVFNVRDIETFKLIANDKKLKELVSELAKYTKHEDVEYDAYKKQLPCLFPMGYSTNKGAKDADVLSNGLFFFDYDGHSEEEMNMGIDKIMNTTELKNNLLYLAKSPSLKGFHAIFLPFNDIDNINQNQIYVDKVLQMPEEHDKNCKNIGRKKFMVPMDYIVYMREDIFELPINQRLTSIGNTKKYTQKISDKNNKVRRETTPVAMDYTYPITDEEKTLIDAYINEDDYVVGQRHSQLQALCTALGKNIYPIQRKDIYIEYIENKVKTFAAFNEIDEPAVRGENGVSELTSLLDWADTKGVIKDNVVPDEIRPRAFRDSFTWQDIVCDFNNIDFPEIIMDNLYTYFFEKNGYPTLKNHYFLPSQIIASAVMLTPHLSGVEIMCPEKNCHSILLQALHCADSADGKSCVEKNNTQGFGIITAEESLKFTTVRSEITESEIKNMNATLRKDDLAMDSTYPALVDNLMRIEKYNRGSAYTYVDEFDEITRKINTADGIPSFVLRKAFDGAKLNKEAKGYESVKGAPRCKISMNACGTLGSLIPLTRSVGDVNNGTTNRMMVLPMIVPAGLKKADSQSYDEQAIRQLIAHMRSMKDVVLDAEYVFGNVYKEIINEYIVNYTQKLNNKDYEAIVGRAIANAERVATIYYIVWLYEQGFTLYKSNEAYTYLANDMRRGKLITNKTKTTYGECANIAVCMDKDGNMIEVPTANEELRKLFRAVFEMCVHGQYKLFDKMLAANNERIDTKFALIADEKKNISAKSEVFRRLPATFTRDDVRQLYREYFPTFKEGTVKNWISDWKKGNMVKDDENKICTKI